MIEDIFVAKSCPHDALVGPLHTVTYVTADARWLETILVDGYSMSTDGWLQPNSDEQAKHNRYLGFGQGTRWQIGGFHKAGVGANARIRAIALAQHAPAIRPNYEGLHKGGATISFPIADLREHEAKMSALGVRTTMGVKEMAFESPSGDRYVSAEIVYLAPDNAFLLGVKRPDMFLPVGPIDDDAGLGGPAYSARCITETDKTLAFFESVLGYEIRRDVVFDVDAESAINLPEGTTERFVQAFAPGASTGYAVFMDHGSATKISETRNYGPPFRGIVMWTFPCKSLSQVHTRCLQFGAEILQPPAMRNSPLLPAGKTMLMRDPDGFVIEVFES